MNRDEMLPLFEAHREAEAARDFDAILATFVDDCFLETVPLGLRAEGKEAARAAYEGFFTAFPDLSPDDQGMAFGDDVIVVWGALRGTSIGDWLGIPRRRLVCGAVRQRRALQGWPAGGREHLLRPRHALRAGGAQRRRNPGSRQGQGGRRFGPVPWLVGCQRHGGRGRTLAGRPCP
jgi:hypothetical protein